MIPWLFAVCRNPRPKLPPKASPLCSLHLVQYQNEKHVNLSLKPTFLRVHVNFHGHRQGQRIFVKNLRLLRLLCNIFFILIPVGESNKRWPRIPWFSPSAQTWWFPVQMLGKILATFDFNKKANIRRENKCIFNFSLDITLWWSCVPKKIRINWFAKYFEN